MRGVSVKERRQIAMRRHFLAGDAESPEAVCRALVALHATDPASVYLSVLARSHSTSLADISAAMYERRSLVRWLGMRRTLFVVPREDVPTIQAAASTPVASMLRRRLVSRLERNRTEPPIWGDLDGWLHELEELVVEALTRRGSATGAQLATDVRALATLIPARTRSETPQRLTSSLLTLMGAEARIVRGQPTGPWTSRHHRWEPLSAWWPEGLPAYETVGAQRELARRWLGRFGPATVDDLRWWTGWNKAITRRALADLEVEEVDLHSEPGIDLSGNDESTQRNVPPTAALLPALDPTPMGWKRREWFLGIDPVRVFDRTGNTGPTVWWDGEAIGSWAVMPTGGIRTALLADRGAEARKAVESRAADLDSRLEGAVVTPAARTPLEHALATGQRI